MNLRRVLARRQRCSRSLLRITATFTTALLLVFIFYFNFVHSYSTSVKRSPDPLPLFPPDHNNFSSTVISSPSFIPDIFDLSLWQSIIFDNHGNQTQCSIPEQYRSITDAYCRAHNKTDCQQLPCTLIYLSPEFIDTVRCLRGGKMALNQEPDWICRKSPALEIFSDPQRPPSIRTKAKTSFTFQLYEQALAPYRDPEKSKWGLTLEGESIQQYHFMMKDEQRFLGLFDMTVGYDGQYFDLVNNPSLSVYADPIINRNKQRLSAYTVRRKKNRKLAPILWIDDNCDVPSNGTAYMLQLMRLIAVDVYGQCGNPKWNATAFSEDPEVAANQKTALAGQYLFTIAIENTLEDDYVTEKLWQPLAAGSVPIYLGAPNVDEWLPCFNFSCVVHLRDFNTVLEAAEFINEIVRDQDRYSQYHQWRREDVMPSFMNMVEYVEEANKHSIECLLCDMVHRNDRGTIRSRLVAANDPFEDTFPSLL